MNVLTVPVPGEAVGVAVRVDVGEGLAVQDKPQGLGVRVGEADTVGDGLVVQQVVVGVADGVRVGVAGGAVEVGVGAGQDAPPSTCRPSPRAPSESSIVLEPAPVKTTT